MIGATKQPNPYQVVINLLATSNQLLKKVVSSQNLKNLIFVILNDTVLLVPYDKAVLWHIRGKQGRKNIKPLGISGQETFSTSSEIVSNWKKLLTDLPDLTTTRQLTQLDFPENVDIWNQVQKTPPCAIIWLPISVEEDDVIGLWLEKWDLPEGQPFYPENLKIFEEYVVPSYALSLRKYINIRGIKSFKEYLHKKSFAYIILGLLLLSFVIQVPLRVVAPCEIVPKDPFIITAQLEGIIAEVDVQSGQNVTKGDLLFHYDPRIVLQELKIAENQTRIIQSELNRVVAAGTENEKSLLDLSTLRLKLQKAELDMEYNKSRARQILERSPVDGIAVIENPDEWRGRPVKVGEKVMVISNPKQSKVKLWIPENDNLNFDFSRPITVFLNTNPEVSYYAHLTQIYQEATLSELHVPSFVAEAQWTEAPSDVKLGVKGHAIIYGEKVSLFYYILRKPITSLRVFLQV